MTDAEILTVARNKLIKNEEIYVCHAIRSIGEEDRQYIGQCNKLEDWVVSMIFPHHTIYSWIMRNVSSDLHIDVHEYRIEWMSKLITLCQDDK